MTETLAQWVWASAVLLAATGLLAFADVHVFRIFASF